MASPDAIAIALAPMIQRNDELRDELNDLKNKIAPTIEELRIVKGQLRDALAEKAALEQEMLLSGAQKAAQKRAWRVSGIPKAIATVIMLCAMPTMFASVLLPVLQPYFPIVFWTAGIAMTLVFLTLRPTDVMALRVVAALWPSMQIQNTAMMGVTIYFILRGSIDYPDGESIRYEQVMMLGSSYLCSYVMFFFVFKAIKHKHGKRMPLSANRDLKAWAVSRYGSIKGSLLANGNAQVAWAIREQLAGNFVVTPRESYLTLIAMVPWMLMIGFGLPLALSGYFVSQETAETTSNAMRHSRFCISMGTGVAILIALVCSQTFRGWLHSKLNKLSSGGDAGRAAGVASLIGKKDVQAVLAQARRGFTGVPFSRMGIEHFETNKADAALMQGVARRCQLGEVDALYAPTNARPWPCRGALLLTDPAPSFDFSFARSLSHSWHDEPSEKWHALQQWSVDFVERHHREPILWFDKACLRQDDIEDQLAQLPVFLAGSRTLLCIVGPTYVQRIWCIIEIFTFLRIGRMGADRLTIVPISDGSAEQPTSELSVRDRELRDEELLNVALERFRSFDVSQAQCFDPVQLDHLLSVIEAGFGSFDTFNSIVRHAFANQLEQVLADSLQHHSAGIPMLSSSGKGSSKSGSSKLVARSVGHRVSSSGALVAPSNMSATRSSAMLAVEDVDS